MVKRQKILIVDDSEMNRALLLDMLEDKYEVVEAENGKEAISILSEHKEEFSLLLLDIMMPCMNGFEVLEYITEHQWDDNFAVIMISSDDSPESIKKTYELGAFDYISRPFDPAVVERRIVNTLLLYTRQKELEEIVVDQLKEQENNNELMISILSHIVEFRNGESGAHVLNVNKITKHLLKRLTEHTDQYALTQNDITLISTASALHDIGKISIPSEILNKPGKLTPEEFEIIKTHSTIGASMLMDLPLEQREEPLVKVAAQICRWHHERYDGNGYPDGLKGEEIPIAAQVVSLADVYDALTSERCYKKAFSRDEALDMILTGKCGTFNPMLLLCLQEVAEKFKDESFITKDRELKEIRDKIDYDTLFFKDEKKDNNQELSLKQRYEQLLYVDSLTNVYNRRYYDECFSAANDIQTIAMFDVDDFKYINDNYGHDVGDIVLKRVAQTVLSNIRKTDALIRYGGDEFVIVFYSMLPNIFEGKLESIRKTVEDIRFEEYSDLQVTISVGGVMGNAETKQLFKIADNMLYESKKQKNKVTVSLID